MTFKKPIKENAYLCETPHSKANRSRLDKAMEAKIKDCKMEEADRHPDCTGKFYQKEEKQALCEACQKKIRREREEKR